MKCYLPYYRFALEDCTERNGCLSFVPGSHRDGLCNKRLVRDNNLVNTINNISLQPTIEQINAIHTPPNNENTTTSFIGTDKQLYQPSDFVCEPVSKGSLVIIHGDVIHTSTANKSDKSRYIYTFHCIEAMNTTYPNTNWLQSAKPFTHLLSSQINTQPT